MNEQTKQSPFAFPSSASGVTGSETGSNFQAANPGGEQTAASKAALITEQRTMEKREREKADLLVLTQDLDSLDWKKVKPHIMAQILTRIPYKGKKDDPPYYLTPTQALVFAMEAYRMGLSPLSNQCFFNRDSHKVNATLEGKKAMSREQGFNFGPPKYTRQEKPFAKGKQVVGFPQDVGITASMQIKGFDDRAEYTAWLSEWYVSSSPVWREKPEHMLQVRALEKAISMASGVGSSEMPSENDLEPPIAGLIQPEKPAIEATEFTYHPEK